MKKNRALHDIFSLFLKFLLIMIFPLQIVSGDILYGRDMLNPFILPATGFLFTPIQINTIFIPESVWIMFDLSAILRNLVIGALVASPGIIFTYKLSRTPVNKSYWKRGLWTGFGLFGLVFAIMIFLSLNMYNPTGFYNDNYWSLMNNLQYYATLVFGVFIILPLVQRQAVIIGSPKFLHDYSKHDLESNPKLSLTREKFLSGILWAFLCFVPYAIGRNMMYPYYGGIPFSGLLMNVHWGSYREIVYTIVPYSTQISMSLTDFMSLPIIAFVCIFQFMFVRDIYRYLSKSITKQRLMGMAILSVFGPLLLSTSVLSIVFYYTFASIPIPLLQIVGLLVVRYHHPIADEVDRVWEDDEATMWWEEPRKKREPPVISTPERPRRNHEHEMITVPVHYLLLSKLRQINRRGN